MPASDDSIVPGEREFHTTRWSLVQAAQGGQADAALAALCKDYWYPLYAFVRRRGYAPHDAQDLTQAFFADLLQRRGPAAHPAQGRFRSYLLGALKHFLANDWHRRNALKRGGGQPVLEWDALDAEALYTLEPADPRDAETLYDRRWAMDLLERALTKLHQDFAASGEGATFAILRSTLTDQGGPPREELARRLSMTEGALKVAVHRLRHRYRAAVRGEIAQTVSTEADVDDEMRHLVAMLRR